MLIQKNDLGFLSCACSLLSVCGCEKQYKADDGYVAEFANINVEEKKESHFFESDHNFNFSKLTFISMENLLRDARAQHVTNVSFVLISDTSIPINIQEKIKKRIAAIMNKHRFINSRIADNGVCMYKGAKPGVKINILRYNVENQDCCTWSEYIGDIDTNKNMPKFGVANVHNTTNMIENKADFIAPRKYSGPSAASAIAAAGSSGGSSGSSSS